MEMPKDNAILLSVINTKLRDFYGSLDELCKDLCWDRGEIEKKLLTLSYTYDKDKNQFI
ncbi:MAG: DUF4250 domain-containing protein [Clostridia bacterium]|nr:DUF4250 domain-containing protein [Clostridia bacterium]